MTRREKIDAALRAAFHPAHLEVLDESEKHRGHGGYREGGETHFQVVIRATALGPMGRLARHRAIHGAIGADLMAEIHALAIDAAG